jgi:N6-adenosine-specific RNA methylase IME4
MEIAISDSVSLRPLAGDLPAVNVCSALGSVHRPGQALVVAREIWRERQLHGLVGLELERALESLCARLRGLAAAPTGLDDLTLVRIRAAALGCAVRAPTAKMRTRPGEIATEWLRDAEQRLAVVQDYVTRTGRAGVMGRPGVRYGVVMADPAWIYKDMGSRAAPSYSGEGREMARYAQMPDAELLAMGEGVRAVSAPSAILFLWATSPIVAEGRHVAVCQAFGFQPKVIVPWLKTTAAGTPAIGMGHYTRGCTEELVGATRGDLDLVCEGDRLVLAARGRASSEVVALHSVAGLIVSKRGAHSVKPDEGYRLVEELCGDVPRLELFARRRRPGWDAWGDEVPAVVEQMKPPVIPGLLKNCPHGRRYRDREDQPQALVCGCSDAG